MDTAGAEPTAANRCGPGGEDAMIQVVSHSDGEKAAAPERRKGARGEIPAGVLFSCFNTSGVQRFFSGSIQDCSENGMQIESDAGFRKGTIRPHFTIRTLQPFQEGGAIGASFQMVLELLTLRRVQTLVHGRTESLPILSARLHDLDLSRFRRRTRARLIRDITVPSEHPRTWAI